MKLDQRKYLFGKDFYREIISVLPALLLSKALVLFAWLLSKLFSGAFEPTNGERFDRGLMAWDGDWYSSLVLNGYDGVLEEGVRFFPGYVMAGRFFDALLPGSANTSLIFGICGKPLLNGQYFLLYCTKKRKLENSCSFCIPGIFFKANRSTVGNSNNLCSMRKLETARQEKFLKSSYRVVL